jgi:hypothetical protein
MRDAESRVVQADVHPLLLRAIYSIGSPQRQALFHARHQLPITLVVPGRGSPPPVSMPSSTRMGCAAGGPVADRLDRVAALAQRTDGLPEASLEAQAGDCPRLAHQLKVGLDLPE